MGLRFPNGIEPNRSQRLSVSPFAISALVLMDDVWRFCVGLFPNWNDVEKAALGINDFVCFVCCINHWIAVYP